MDSFLFEEMINDMNDDAEYTPAFIPTKFINGRALHMNPSTVEDFEKLTADIESFARYNPEDLFAYGADKLDESEEELKVWAEVKSDRAADIRTLLCMGRNHIADVTRFSVAESGDAVRITYVFKKRLWQNEDNISV